jgi:nitroimidazol reductase NimA-like FMN-containing flavoprotein (pyridoxamine 5'-phosphate oxidase superfamily)
MDRDRNGLEVLDRAGCLQLLAGAAFGRVALTAGALPVILPVTYKLVAERVVFSTASGAKMRAATAHAVIAFEVDHLDVLSHSGWSVLVTDIARPVYDEAEAEALWGAGVPRWLAGDDAALVTLATERISGRRLVPAGAAAGAASAGAAVA